jgi:hypothetical protein
MRRTILLLFAACGLAAACSTPTGDGATGAAGASAGTNGNAGTTGTGGAAAGTTGAAGTGVAGTGAAGTGAAGSSGGTTGAAGGGATADGGSGDGRDATTVGDAPTSPADAGKLQECTSPSIDRIQSWNATMGEGDMTPSGGSLLVKEGDHYVAKVVLHGTGWHVLPVYLSNAAGGGMVDLSTSTGFTLTYSTTADLWIQMRPSNHWNGGVQWVTKVPASGGALVSRFFPLAKESWTYLNQLGGMPSWPYEEARAQVRGFVIVGNQPNTVLFTGLRFDGYVPVCRP